MPPNVVSPETASEVLPADDATSSVTPSLCTQVAGITLSKVLLNSSNPFATSVDDLQSLADSPASGAFATRTACPNFEHDDAKHKWRYDKVGNTINCLGYSSQTFEYYIDAVKQVHTTSSKPAFISLSGYANEIADMVQQLGTAFADALGTILVEINLSCPNIPGKPPIAYDFEAMKDYLTTVFARGNYGLKVGVKLTPYFYDGQFIEAALVLNEFYPLLCFVTSINTVGCGLVIDLDTEAPVLTPGSFGGLGGPAVHATALGNVRRLRSLLRPELDLIGCGGVDSGEAAFRHILCGAQVVMVASALLTRGVGVLEIIETELLAIMEKKGYTCLEDFRGKLRDEAAGGSCSSSRK
jgi:dihydroorotate dehydrogenase (fumarate)